VRRLAPLVLALAACVPELGRVLPDRGGSVDDLPVWQGPELPTQIGVGDTSRFDAVSIHTKPDAAAGDAALDVPPLDQRPPDLDPGHWHQANQKNCPSYCQGLGLANVPGPEGAHCMSGEVRSGSGIAQGITFPWGCYSSCAPMGPHQASSEGTNCYMPGQKKDGDPTDRTVGCYCR
jgi:hypothetical protein